MTRPAGHSSASATCAGSKLPAQKAGANSRTPHERDFEAAPLLVDFGGGWMDNPVQVSPLALQPKVIEAAQGNFVGSAMTEFLWRLQT
jgi:hypothetical protein